MAEGLCRHLLGSEVEVYSAGTETHGLNPLAAKVMAEIGIDISGHYSKTLEALIGVDFDFVITVCGHADENCPVFPGKTRVIHQAFDDPPKLAAGAATEVEALVHYRRVRDEIKNYITTLPIILDTG
jgi:arsenate reductase (thioredoxin)